MTEVLLERFAYTPHGTFGRLSVDDFRCFTVERPWLDNRRNVSCIPTGRYGLRLGVHRRNTPDPSDDYPAYEVDGVAGRSLIKIHVANTMADVRGCIGLGRTLGYDPDDGLWAVASSRDAHNAFMAAMAGTPYAAITIVDRFPYKWE